MILLFACHLSIVFGLNISSRLDFEQTFKYPFFLKHVSLPFYNITGGREYLRLAPSVPDRSGAVLCNTANPHAEWSSLVKFSVQGRGMAGGKGLVFWYTRDNTKVDKPDFFGRSSVFSGLAIVLDFSDMAQNRYNPYIYGLVNDGTKKGPDFINYASAQVNIGSCFRQIRNTVHPVWLRVSYVAKTLTVELDVQHDKKDFVECFTAQNIELPTGYYFGVSAATNNWAVDDHNVYSMEIFQASPPIPEHKLRPHEEEQKKAGHEFHLTKEYEEEIAKVEKAIRESRANDTMEEFPEDTVTPQLIQRLEENQFHMIEALNRIEKDLGEKPTMAAGHKDGLTIKDQREFEERMTLELKEFHGVVSNLEKQVKQLQNLLGDIASKNLDALQSLERNVKSSQGILASTHQKVSDSNANAQAQHQTVAQHSSTLYNALYIFATLAGLGVILFAYTSFQRSQQATIKKFI